MNVRINRFLDAYTGAYELKNLPAFAAFFTPDARENNAPFKSKFPQYRKLFSRVENITYKIKPTSWQARNDQVTVKGRFHASFRYRNGRKLDIHGNTSLILHETPNHDFKVQNLSYTIE
jgi:hypothetical protein